VSRMLGLEYKDQLAEFCELMEVGILKIQDDKEDYEKELSLKLRAGGWDTDVVSRMLGLEYNVELASGDQGRSRSRSRELKFTRVWVQDSSSSSLSLREWEKERDSSRIFKMNLLRQAMTGRPRRSKYKASTCPTLSSELCFDLWLSAIFVKDSDE
jgi:hypothetical protein